MATFKINYDIPLGDEDKIERNRYLGANEFIHDLNNLNIAITKMLENTRI